MVPARILCIALIGGGFILLIVESFASVFTSSPLRIVAPIGMVGAGFVVLFILSKLGSRRDDDPPGTPGTPNAKADDDHPPDHSGGNDAA